MAKLDRPLDFYTPRRIESAARNDVEYSAMKKEYTRLRKIWTKRVKNIARTKGQALDLTQSATYRNMAQYPVLKLKDIKSRSQFSYEFSKLARTLADKYSTAAEMKRTANKSIKTLKQHGYKQISQRNILQFGQFMEMYRERKLGHVVGSPDAADLFNVLTRRKIDVNAVWDNFEEWAAGVKKLQKVKPKPHRGVRNSTYYAGILGITDKESANSVPGKLSKSSKRGRAIKRRGRRH